MTTATADTMTPPNEGGFMARLRGLWARWQGASRSDRQVLVIAVMATVVATVIVLVLWTASRGYRPLYGSQEGFDSAEIIEVLEAEKIPYRMQADSGQILVLEDQLGRARMTLAARGIRAKMPAGMELLDKAGALGSSQFLEEARYRLGLEGELSRTIMAMKAVRSARVHLAIPKRTLFIRQQPEKPSAAVMLELYSGATLSRDQVEAIVNLVVGAVTAMPVDAVSVVDQNGRLLSADLELAQELARSGERQLTYNQQMEQALNQRASDMLQPILGYGNYRVQVAARVNFDQIEETREQVDPENTVVTREASRSDTRGGNLAIGIPGALSNQPPATNADEEEAAPAQNLSSESERYFETSRAVRHTKFQQAQLERLSVSVLLNSEAGQWSQAQLDQLGQLVQDAIGFEAARGDSLSLHAFPFAAQPVPEMEPLPWWQTQEYQLYLRYLIGALLGLGLILFVLRPLVKHLTRTVEQEKAQAEAAQAALLPKHEPVVEPATPELPPPGSALSVQLEHLSLLANEEPARVAEVITQWMSNNERD
ncbi:flagellar basal-body MS-ring/collar protein FliF [Ferrimonas balearica]|uniref:flagellar basal-body MS-ring/collar protein FliF n=1 Tax=Ferrimonas balearica TaxID=44012 RepID=UPI001F36737A|nr:flagellar basal-body MS-ring/collar protein FliF [Ferrimonas balearica]MBY6017003.1 flagellar M-ring protein FliF [Halomonas denitrificans]MBY6093278.1 flagellar M-ring protein FliF [Ferrimonas balearica]